MLGHFLPMQFLKIVLVCILAAVLYGVVHDQITARICVEYFSVFHPPVFGTQSPTLLVLGWGIIATWWVGAFLGVLLAIAARAGSRRKLQAPALLNPIAKLLAVMAAGALLTGLTGYLLARNGLMAPPDWVASSLAQSLRPASWLTGGRMARLTDSGWPEGSFFVLRNIENGAAT